jgi:GWxTD domain-containing protein
MTKLSPCITYVILLLCLPAIAMSQTGYIEERGLDEPLFEFNFATFKSETGHDNVLLEVYYKVYNTGLQYFKHDDHFVAKYEIVVQVLDKDGNQIASDSREREYRVDSYRETMNAASFLINKIPLQVPKGKYKVECRLIDKLSEKVSVLEKELNVKHLYDNKIDISDVSLITSAQPATDTRSGFDRGEMRIIPLVSHSVSGDVDRLRFYAEIYSKEDDPSKVRIEYKIKNDRSKTVYSDKFECDLTGPVTRLIKEVPTDELLPDDYEIEFKLNDRRGNKLAERKTKFRLAWSLRALISNDFDLAVEQLKYIATPDERDRLLETPEDKRLDAFEMFWKEHDKYPETEENESRELYYSRIRHANEYFTVVNQPGWKTDRGRIFVIFGEPDHVERYPFELSRVPYQIWYYYGLSRKFVFEDTHQTGDYYLTYPYDGRYGGLHENFSDFE